MSGKRNLKGSGKRMGRRGKAKGSSNSRSIKRETNK